MRAANDLQCIFPGNGLEADPGITPVVAGPGQVGGVLVPEGPGAMPSGFEEHLFGEVPDIFRAPEISEQLAERKGSHKFFQSFLGKRVGIVDMGLLLGSIEHPGRVRTVVLQGPVKRRPATGQLLLVQQALDQNRPVCLKRRA
ncbi:hypothetical protein FQZ97_696630 [compost metagenome]